MFDKLEFRLTEMQVSLDILEDDLVHANSGIGCLIKLLIEQRDEITSLNKELNNLKYKTNYLLDKVKEDLDRKPNKYLYKEENGETPSNY
jgi:hypothetical protein